MDMYKEAFETLATMIKEGDDKELIAVVLELEEGLKDGTGEEMTQEEWDASTYTERVKLKNEHPEIYQAHVAGKFKGGN